jgi:hypothetical protein
MNHGHGQKLTRKQEQAISALLCAGTLQQAAAKAGISYSTLKRWLGDSSFSRAYRNARRELVDGAVGRIQAATGQAVPLVAWPFKPSSAMARMSGPAGRRSL